MVRTQHLPNWLLSNNPRFHVDDLPSAHIYVRLKKDQTIDDIPADVLEDCFQLTKENSKEGSKLSKTTIVYTYWSNLKKTAKMDVGQVAFHDENLVRKRDVSKEKNILKVLDKTKEFKEVDFKEERALRDKQEQQAKKKEKELQRLKEKKEIEEKRKQKDMLHYVGVFDESQKRSNKEGTGNYKDLEDDFM